MSSTIRWLLEDAVGWSLLWTIVFGVPVVLWLALWFVLPGVLFLIVLGLPSLLGLFVACWSALSGADRAREGAGAGTGGTVTEP